MTTLNILRSLCKYFEDGLAGTGIKLLFMQKDDAASTEPEVKCLNIAFDDLAYDEDMDDSKRKSATCMLSYLDNSELQVIDKIDAINLLLDTGCAPVYDFTSDPVTGAVTVTAQFGKITWNRHDAMSWSDLSADDYSSWVASFTIRFLKN